MIVLPNGEIFQKHGGIPSGSGLTSLLGSLCNIIILDNILSSYDETNLGYKFIVYGDDSLLSLYDKTGITNEKDEIKTKEIV